MGLGSKFTLRVTGRPGGPEAEELLSAPPQLPAHLLRVLPVWLRLLPPDS